MSVFLLGQPIQRILFILYGQSNMGGFVGMSISPPAALPNTQWYDPLIPGITTVPNANGIREFLNAVSLATGKICIALSGAVAGASIAGLEKGTSNYTDLFTQINAVRLITDEVHILYDQGEGDAASSPHPDANIYRGKLVQLHTDMATDMGLRPDQVPFFISSLGTTSLTPGDLNTGTTNTSWNTIKTAHWEATLDDPYMTFSHTNYDAVRNAGDVYHYDGTSQGRAGKRFAQTFKARIGLAPGPSYFEVANATTVDATHTDVNLTHKGGTDFTPTSGGTGWEVSGNNGATWITATASRTNGSKLSLTHASISTTSTRLVRYLSGMMPPDSSGVNPPTAPILDNKLVPSPLRPTTWEIRPTPLTTLPVPTWRYNIRMTGSNKIQTANNLPLGPRSGQCFGIVTLAGAGLTPATFTVTPNIGSAVSAVLVKAQGSVKIFQFTLGSDANAASTISIALDYGASDPFAGNVAQLWTVPLSDLSSTTATTGGSTTASSAAGTATVNVSAGGFITIVSKTIGGYSIPVVLTGDESYAGRFEDPSPFCTISADASNCTANAASSFTATYSVSGTVDIAMAAFR